MHMRLLKFVSLQAALAAATIVSAQHYPIEASSMADMLSRSGWKTRIVTEPHVCALLVSRDKKGTYLFTFQRAGDTYERYVCEEPNLLKKYNWASDPGNLFFGPWPVSESVALAKAFGYYDSSFQVVAKQTAKCEVPEVSKFPLPEKTRRLTRQEAKLILAGLKKSDEVYKNFEDNKGHTIHGLPYDTDVFQAWAYKNWYVMDLQSKQFEGVGYYQFLFRTVANRIQMMWNWPEDGDSIVYKPEFRLAQKLIADSKMNVYWDVDDSKFAKTGLWMRERLKKPSHAWIWTPDEMDAIVQKLDRLSNDKKMLLYAKSGKWAVAQFYDDNNVLRVIEFLDGKILHDYNLDQAIDSAAHLKDDDLWYSYEGVARQGGHPFIMEALYKNANKR